MPSSPTNNDSAVHGTQTSTFSWDDNDDAYEDLEQEAMDVEVPKEVGWKRIWSERRKSTIKRGKTNGKVELNTKGELPEEETPSAAELMKACGKVALDQ
eukprot:11747432-Ditylum_brightwellii.AAC.1